MTLDTTAVLTGPRAARRGGWPRRLVGAGFAIAVLLMLVNLGTLLLAALVALGYPYDLDYGEGIVWQQLRNIVAGTGYGPLGVYPAVVYHYPPVYHLMTAATAWAFGLDQLFAGRLVSLLSTVAMMGLVGRLVVSAMPRGEDRVLQLAAAGIGGLCLASIPSILSWAFLMRVDMLACALTLAGLALGIRAIERPSAIPFAALAFVLAIYTKQTSIAGPVAVFAALWLVRPRAAIVLFACCAGLGLIALGGLSLASDGGFLRHILLYNINRLDLSRIDLLAWILTSQAMLIAMAAFAIVASWRRLELGRPLALRAKLAGDPSKAAPLILLLFLAVKTMMLPMILKSGSSDNYIIEWSCGMAVFVGLAAVPVLKFVRDGTAAPSLVLLLLFTVALPVTAWQTPASEPDAAGARYQGALMAGVVTDIRASAKPVISDDMVLLIRAGRDVQWEPAIAAELAHGRVYDEAAFAGMVRRHAFGFFITHDGPGAVFFKQRYNPVVADAIEAAYPRRRQVGPLVYHLPPAGQP